LSDWWGKNEKFKRGGVDRWVSKKHENRSENGDAGEKVRGLEAKIKVRPNLL